MEKEICTITAPTPLTIFVDIFSRPRQRFKFLVVVAAVAHAQVRAVLAWGYGV
jgi:hypothetical protein